MPNWVYNGLTIEGNPDEVNKLVAQMNKPFVDYIESNGDLAFGIKQRKYINPIFSFRNIIAPTDLEEYKKQPWEYANGEVVATNEDSWYNFNNREWGVKWDVAVAEDDKYPETYMEGPVANGDNLVVYYNFNTAWGIPDEALTKLSSQYPSLLFTLSYEEETGWGGEHEYLRGVQLQGSEYNWKCRECDYMEINEPPYCEDCEYDMCPSCGYGEPDDACEVHRVKADA
jgi:Ferredoxin-like domain in Api92-like protein